MSVKFTRLIYTRNMVYILNLKDCTAFLIQLIFSLYWGLNLKPSDPLTDDIPMCHCAYLGQSLLQTDKVTNYLTLNTRCSGLYISTICWVLVIHTYLTTIKGPLWYLSQTKNFGLFDWKVIVNLNLIKVAKKSVWVVLPKSCCTSNCDKNDQRSQRNISLKKGLTTTNHNMKTFNEADYQNRKHQHSGGRSKSLPVLL